MVRANSTVCDRDPRDAARLLTHQYRLLACFPVSGTAGGIAVVAVGHPFDTVKVRLQSQSISKPIYSGAFDCVKKTLAWEGVGGLYKGVASPLAGQMLLEVLLSLLMGQIVISMIDF